MARLHRKYYSGVSGTVDLAAGEKLVGLWCVGDTGGGTLSIDNGTDIPIPSGLPFSKALESGQFDWIGVRLIFTGTKSYYVETLAPVT